MPDLLLKQVKQLRDWLQHWEANFGHTGGKGAKGKKRDAASSSPALKKAVLLSGTPGIGKTTTARLVCAELGYETLEVRAFSHFFLFIWLLQIQ